MATKKKLLQAAAGNAGGAGAVLNVEDVFSTYLYDGNGSTQKITNGINLGDNLTGPYTEIADPISGVGGYLYRNSDFSGNADGKTLTFSGWAYNTGGNLYLYNSRTLQDSGTASFNAIMSNGLFKVQSYNSSDTKILDTGWRTVSLNGWFHFLISVDLSSTSNRYLYINDVEELGPSSSWNTYTNDSINFTNSHHYVNAYRSSANNGVDAGGGLAQIYLDYTYRDLSVVSNRRTFVTADIAPAGNLSSLNPILYLPFDATNSTGSNLGTGGDFVAYNTSYFTAKETGGPGYDAGSGEGGLTWIKSRTNTGFHFLFDTERGALEALSSELTNGEITRSSSLTAFNSNGFSVGSFAASNGSGQDYASWTFRKAPKFFDVVTYTGDGTGNQNIPHNLGATPGCIIVKRTDTTEDWWVYHRSIVTNDQLKLNSTAAAGVGSFRFGVDGSNFDINQSTFSVGGGSFGALDLNQNNATYVAYLFAHNNNDGTFGPDGDADAIKCGSYTGDGTTDGSKEIDLGFEPQWLIIKKADGTSDWFVLDVMRGITDSSGAKIEANTSAAEAIGNSKVLPSASGFRVYTPNQNNSGSDYIYIAIRRGTKVPESGTDVFDVNQTTSNQFVTTGFPVDLQIGQYTGGGSNYVVDRMRGMSTSTTGSMKYLVTRSTGAEASNTGSLGFNGFVQNGFSHTLGNYEQALWSWKRAPKYMDVVAYTGDGTNGRAISHNLGVAPEMMWVKVRNASNDWVVYHKDLGEDTILKLNSTSATISKNVFSSNVPTDSVFYVQASAGYDVNYSTSQNYIAYLFATLDGISKVGSFTHTSGSSTNVDCGFSSGARFVLVKRTDGSGDWMVWDTERGIVSGNDPYLKLNNSQAETTNTDYIDPLSSGFTITSSLISGDYIFYAIA